MTVFSNTVPPGHSYKETGPPGYKSFPVWIKIVFVLSTIVKLLLVSSQTLTVNYADSLTFVHLAKNIVEGRWLGTYGAGTLAKGPFYPLYIAATFFAGIPLLFSQQLLYIAACATFVAAIRGFVKRPLTLAVIYLVLLFNPMSFSAWFMGQVLREGIYNSLTIFTISCCIGLLSQHDRSFKRLALWSTGLGLSLPAFWLTREEGIWLLPAVIIIVAFAMVKIWLERPEDRTKRLSLCVLPFIIWFLLVGTVASINKSHYGVFRITDFKSRGFLSALGALMRVKHTEWKPKLPVPAEARERIYKVSPAFAELRPFLEGESSKRLRIFGSCKQIGICDDIGGGWFMWAFRGAVARAGHYRSAKDADNYYMTLAGEIKEACSDKRLDCLPGKASMSIVPPLSSYYLRPFLKAFTQGAVSLSRFRGFSVEIYNGENRWLPETRMLFRDITGEQTTPSRTGRSIIVLKGWAFHPDYPIDLSVRTKDGGATQAWMETKESPGIYKAFMKKGITAAHLKKANFIIRTYCGGCYLYVSRGRTIIDRIPIKRILKSGRLRRRLRTSSYYANFDSGATKAQLRYRLWLEKIKGGVLKKIAALYQYTAPFLFVLALVIQVLGTIQMFRRKVATPYVINIALLTAILLRLSILSIIDITLFPAVNYTGYLSSAHPLLLMVIIFSLLGCKTLFPRRTPSTVE